MTPEQIQQRIAALENEIAQLRRQLMPLQPLPSVADTFGMFADDPEFVEMIRLGREYRQSTQRTEM